MLKSIPALKKYTATVAALVTNISHEKHYQHGHPPLPPPFNPDLCLYPVASHNAATIVEQLSATRVQDGVTMVTSTPATTLIARF